MVKVFGDGWSGLSRDHGNNNQSIAKGGKPLFFRSKLPVGTAEGSRTEVWHFFHGDIEQACVARSYALPPRKSEYFLFLFPKTESCFFSC